MTENIVNKLIAAHDAEAQSATTIFSDHVVPEDTWMKESDEGQLAVDVYQEGDTIVVEAPIAGVRSEDLDISLHHDMVTIRGVRLRRAATTDDNFFYRECHWGAFSRSIILPTDVRAEDANAILKNGILTITLPKAKTSRLLRVQSAE